jgi:hypothetical protein
MDATTIAIFTKMTNKELREFIEKRGLLKPKSAVRTKDQLIAYINTHWKPFKNLNEPTGEGGNPYANGAFDADYCKCWKCFEKGVVIHVHPELSTAEFQFNHPDGEITTEFLPVCEKCYDDWDDICERCDSRVCTLRDWEDFKGETCYYCDDCYADDEERIEEMCENCDSRQCIEDEDYCRSCKEDLEEEEEEDSDDEGDGMMECLECKGRFPTTIVSKWGSICAPCFQIHRKAEEECKAMGAEDFDAPAPVFPSNQLCRRCKEEPIVRGESLCRGCFLIDESDDESEDDAEPVPAPPKPSAWDERVTGDFKNITICEIFGDECTWRTLGNLSSDPDTDSQLDVRLHYYNEGKHFQVRVFVNGGSILDRHYAECGTLGEIFPHHMMEELEFYFPGYFEEDKSKENSLVSRINATL